jgi:hypothetical protein
MRFVVCPRCQGTGYGDNLGDVTEWVHEDPDFAEDYAAGVYNTGCPRCAGVRVVRACEADSRCGEAAVQGHYTRWDAETDDDEVITFTECYLHLSGEAREQWESEQELLAMEAAERRVGA